MVLDTNLNATLWASSPLGNSHTHTHTHKTCTTKKQRGTPTERERKREREREERGEERRKRWEMRESEREEQRERERERERERRERRERERERERRRERERGKREREKREEEERGERERGEERGERRERERERERERITQSLQSRSFLRSSGWGCSRLSSSISMRMLERAEADGGELIGPPETTHISPAILYCQFPKLTRTMNGSRCWIIWADLLCMPPFLLLVSCISCCFGKSRGDSHSKGIGYGHHSTMRPLSPWLILTQRMLPASLILDQHLVSQQQLATSDGESTISTSTAWIHGARKSSRRHLQPHGWRAPPMEQRWSGAATPKVWSR